VACSAAIAASFQSLPTFAQSGGALEEVIVTATRRDESLQDVAVSVAAITRELGQAQVRRLEDLDIQRIEILRGPQGTLFGKNTTGGLINIIRGDVTMEWGGDVSLTVDEYGREDVKAVVNVPLIDDKLGIKLFGAQIKNDGWVYNRTLERDVGEDDILNYGFAMK
jgi:iron complex outermembrane receptor protein